MTLPRNRWLLPVGHLLIDCLIASLWLWHTHLLVNRVRAALPPQHLFRPVLLQESATIPWHFDWCSHADPAPEFTLLATGNIIAAAISIEVSPSSHGCDTLELNPVWFLIFEGIALALWFVFGFACDSGFFRIEKWFRRDLGVRAVGGIFAMTKAAAVFAGFASWLLSVWFALYALVRVCAWGWKRVRNRGQLETL